MFVHGYHTCWVESSHNERAVYTSKRVEMWRNWKGKCRLVQLFHNHGVEATAEMVRHHLGWQVTEEVRQQWRKIDRDKAKHREIKADPSYNRRQWEIALKRQARKAEAKAAAEAVAKEEKRKERETMKAEKGKEEKTRMVATVAHTYSVKKRPLYADVEKTGGKEEKRGSGRKRKADEMVASTSSALPEKENVMPDCAQPAVKRSTMTAVGARQVLDEVLIDWNR
jgi:RecA-family ATPase